jgi:hypothetical protein
VKDAAPSRVNDRSLIHVRPGARVVLWGDSLADESKERFVEWLRFWSANRLDVSTNTYGGTATCDWSTRIADTAARERPAVAVLEFSGNALTACMTGTDGRSLTGRAYLDAYRTATMHAVTALRDAGTRVYVIGTPRGRTTAATSDGAMLRTMYERLARHLNGVVFVDAGAAVLGPAGRWTNTLPCLPEETGANGCVAGRIVVRAPDSAHFCPGAGPAVRGVTGSCPRWSSGALRFGRAMAAPIIADLRVAL